MKYNCYIYHINLKSASLLLDNLKKINKKTIINVRGSRRV